MLARQDTVNAVPSRLRLARDNGYFAAYPGIGQCGFTDIGPPDNSDEPAMARFSHFLSCVTATGSESCADLPAFDLPLAHSAGELLLFASCASLAAACSAPRPLA